MNARMENARMQQLKKKNGFTLVEMLIVVTLLGIFSVAVTQVFFTILRTQAKTQSIAEAKQSGDYAFSVMETAIRNAKSIDFPVCGDSDPTSITITNQDDTQITFSCSGNKIKSGTQNLTGDNVIVDSCNFTHVCQTSTAQYVYFNYTVKPGNVPTGDPIQSASEPYQGTVTIRNVQE